MEGLHRILDNVVRCSSDGWSERTLQFGNAKVSIFLKDTALWLRQQLSDPKYANTLVLRAEEKYRGSQRVYGRPENCEQQAKLPPGAFVAAIQIHSDKTCLDHKGNQVWPVKLALLNVPKEQRRAAIETVVRYHGM